MFFIPTTDRKETEVIDATNKYGEKDRVGVN
jgi:hypothetical protein